MSKYHNEKTFYKGKRYDSKKEANRSYELDLMQRAGKIQDLQRQVPYLLIPAQYENGKCIFKSCKYIADFVYWENGKLVVEDTKGVRTDVYKIKKKLMFLNYGIKIKEV